MALVRRSELRESALGAKALDERTSDESASLYGEAVLYGIGTGAWISVLTEPKTAAGAILPVLAFGGAAVGTVALLDAGKPPRYGTPQSITAGLNIGLEEGIIWSLWNQARTT